jgi:hypothetical protein
MILSGRLGLFYRLFSKQPMDIPLVAILTATSGDGDRLTLQGGANTAI